MTTTVTIHGRPVPWKRPQRARQGHRYTHPDVKQWADTFAWEAKVEHAGEPWTGPVWAIVEVSDSFLRATFGEAGESGAARFDSIRPTGIRGDIDNYVKLVLDAAEGVVYQNDRQVLTVHAGFVEGGTDG